MSKFLHVRINDAAANGDHSPAARNRAGKTAVRLENASVNELIERGAGWISDEPLGREFLVGNYDSFRTEEITDEQADRWFAIAGSAIVQ